MGNFNFADAYRRAGLNPGPDMIRLRQEPFDKARADTTTHQVLDLTRILFDLTPATPDGFDWFRDLFAETDPSFSMIDNKRESAVLASCLLTSAIRDGNVAAGLAVLVTSVARNRMPILSEDIVHTAKAELDRLSVEARLGEVGDVSGILQPTPSKTSFDADAIAADSDGKVVAGFLKKLNDESRATTATLAGQVSGVFSPLHEQVLDLREQVDMLWWFIGASSRVLNEPFSELDISLAACMAGVDLADLTIRHPGPVATRAILHRSIFTGRREKTKNVTIRDAVDAFPASSYSNLGLISGLVQVPDICPVLTAFRIASEIGASPNWHDAYRNCAQLPKGESTALPVIDLAEQVYRERLLVSMVKE